MRYRSRFQIPSGLRSLFPAGLILGLTLVPAGIAGAHPCDSSKQNIRDGDIHALEILNAVDRDGDGYYSSFNLKLVSDTRVSRPRRQGKEAFRKVYNTLSQFLPAPPAPGKACFDLIPGYLVKGRVAPLAKRLEDTDFEGNELPPMGSPTPIEHQLGVHKPHSKDSYWGPASSAT